MRIPWVTLKVVGNPGYIMAELAYIGHCGIKDNEDEINSMYKLDSGTLIMHPRNIWNPKYTDAFKNEFNSLTKTINPNDSICNNNIVVIQSACMSRQEIERLL